MSQDEVSPCGALPSALILAPGHPIVFSPGWGPGVGDGNLTTPLEVLQILVIFTHLPATVYFSEPSNTCSAYSVQVLWLQLIGKTGWRVVTPSCSGP